MFEKEAEEYAKKRAKELWINECNLAYATMERAFQKGAEFGYNKAKEELEICAEYSHFKCKREGQLTKAKEIIKMLHSDCYSIAECEDTNLGLWEDDLAKAEAFLNSEVEK